MFGLGTSEIIIILVIALLVLGPKNLPKVARSLGRVFGQVQRMTSDLSNAMQQEAMEIDRQESRRKESTVVSAKPVKPTSPNQDAAHSTTGDPYFDGDLEDSDSVKTIHDRPGPPDPEMIPEPEETRDSQKQEKT